MKIVTFNIRCDFNQDGENSFCCRKELILHKLEEEMPDIICFQEVLPHVAQWLKESLTDYYVIGCGRDVELRDEQMTIAYRKTAMNLMSMETFWLSKTPYVPASRYEEQSICPRVCTEAVFEDMESGQLFRVVDVHLDHEGTRARQLGLRQILEKVGDTPFFPEIPVILAGDFNAEPFMEEIKEMDSHPEYRDVAAELGGTFHDFGQLEQPEKIDYIYVNGGVMCTKAEKWTDCVDGVYLSDHYPVMAELTWKK